MVAAGYSEAGDGHEVRRNVVHIVRRVIGLFVIGEIVTGLNEGWSSGTISGKFEGGCQLLVLCYG